MQRITITVVAASDATPAELAERLCKHAAEAAEAIGRHDTRQDLMQTGRGGEADRWAWHAEQFFTT